MKPLQIHIQRKEVLEANAQIKSKYGLTDAEIRKLVAEFLVKLAKDENFYKKYLEKFKEEIENNRVVNPRMLILSLLFER